MRKKTKQYNFKVGEEYIKKMKYLQSKLSFTGIPIGGLEVFKYLVDKAIEQLKENEK